MVGGTDAADIYFRPVAREGKDCIADLKRCLNVGFAIIGAGRWPCRRSLGNNLLFVTNYLTVSSFVVPLWSYESAIMVPEESNPLPRLMHRRILFLAFLFVGLSLSMGAPDQSETAYDESETLFCECTPKFSITEAGSVTAAPGVPSPACRFRLGDLRHRLAHETGSGHQRSESFTIRNHALRC